MYLCCYVNLREGDRGVVTSPDHPDFGCGMRFVALEYAMQRPLYVFEADDGRRLAFASAFDFRIVPYRAGLLDLIDLAIRTGDEQWFNELTTRLQRTTEWQ